jgi:hypothetical protein
MRDFAVLLVAAEPGLPTPAAWATIGLRGYDVEYVWGGIGHGYRRMRWSGTAISTARHLVADLIDPPPDLAIEVDLGGVAINKLTMYAAFGVPEVWRFDGCTLSVFVLAEDRQYKQRQASESFPGLPPVEIERVLARLGTASETALVRAFRQWVQSQAST